MNSIQSASFSAGKLLLNCFVRTCQVTGKVFWIQAKLIGPPLGIGLACSAWNEETPEGYSTNFDYVKDCTAVCTTAHLALLGIHAYFGTAVAIGAGLGCIYALRPLSKGRVEMMLPSLAAGATLGCLVNLIVKAANKLS